MRASGPQLTLVALLVGLGVLFPFVLLAVLTNTCLLSCCLATLLTLLTFLPFYLATLLPCCLAVLLSCYLAVLLSCCLAVLLTFLPCTFATLLPCHLAYLATLQGLAAVRDSCVKQAVQ